MYKVPEKYRAKLPVGHPYRTPEGIMSGLFFVPLSKDVILFCIATNGEGLSNWEHVSVSVKKTKNGLPKYDLNRCPTWEEMCIVKDLFWDKNDVVVQFHPPEQEYISHHDYCLHMWRKQGENFEVPPSFLVGTVKGQNID
jgi:hypothetical protein